MGHSNRHGFSLLEILIAITILLIIMTLATTNLFGTQYKASLNTSIEILLSDINLQRLKAVGGEGIDTNQSQPFGIYFGDNYYVLFTGANYSPEDTGNFTVLLGDNIFFQNTLFPQSQLVFSSGSGEIVNFTPVTSSTVLTNTQTLEQKTILFNKLGTLESIN